MDESTKAKLAQNIRDLPKMASMWVATAVSLAATYYFNLPQLDQQLLLRSLPIPPSMLPILGALLPVVIARVWPQKSLAQTPAGAPQVKP